MGSNVVFVAAGQCGNQLGYSLISNIHRAIVDDGGEKNGGINSEVFFRGTNGARSKKQARCVCLDTEPKAGTVNDQSMFISFYHNI